MGIEKIYLNDNRASKVDRDARETSLICNTLTFLVLWRSRRRHVTQVGNTVNTRKGPQSHQSSVK